MKNQFSVICPRCGAANPMSQTHCINCGAPLPKSKFNQPSDLQKQIRQRIPSRLVAILTIIIAIVIVIIVGAHSQFNSDSTESYNPGEIQLLNGHHRVVKTIYYTKKVESTKGRVIQGKIALIPHADISQPGYHMKQHYQHTAHHYPYRINLNQHRATVNYHGHPVQLLHFNIENEKWLKRSPAELMVGFPGDVHYYRYHYLNDY